MLLVLRLLVGALRARLDCFVASLLAMTARARRRRHVIRSSDSASRTTLRHFSISSLMRAVNSSGVLATGVKPSAASRCLTSPCAAALAISRESSSTISLGVPADASLPVRFRRLNRSVVAEVALS